MRARSVYRIGGTERMSFLQNLVTNDVDRLGEGAVWTALLTPQGKYLADFLLVPETDDSLLLDVGADLAPGLIQRLSMYKLRSDVTIEATDITVASGPGTARDGAFADPRHPDLGWRAYSSAPEGDDKPAKYPVMFRASDLMLLSKSDLIALLMSNSDAKQNCRVALQADPLAVVVLADQMLDTMDRDECVSHLRNVSNKAKELGAIL